MRWFIAFLSAAFGAWILHDSRANQIIARVDQGFQAWLVQESLLPKHPPVPVTLVEMEDAETWTALEYSLFLKAMPDKDPPVVVLENLPPEGNSAYDRAFRDLAIQAPRLILPVALSREGSAEAPPWWLDGWKMERPRAEIATFRSIASAPPEALRGTTAVGVGNLSPTFSPEGQFRSAAYVAMEKMILPSLALRATLLAWKIPAPQASFDSGLVLQRQHLPVGKDGTFLVDLSFLPGVRRIASSDLLLRLEANSNAPTPAEDPLRGVVILGNVSDAQQIPSAPNGQKITRAEVLAAAIATLCNGPVTFPPSRSTLILLLVAAAGLPLFFVKSEPQVRAVAFFAILAAYVLLCIFVAARAAVLLPVFMPAAVFIFGFGLNHFASLLKTQRHERALPTAD